MAEDSENPYRAPDQLTKTGKGSSILAFNRFSAWGVFGLTIITLGIYPIYWMYTRATIVNSLHGKKISSALLNSLVVVTILSFLSNFNSESGMALVVGIVYLVIYLMVLFKIRNRLQDILTGSSKTEQVLGTGFTFFFFTIYLQYKINQCIDEVFENTRKRIQSDTAKLRR